MIDHKINPLIPELQKAFDYLNMAKAISILQQDKLPPFVMSKDWNFLEFKDRRVQLLPNLIRDMDSSKHGFKTLYGRYYGNTPPTKDELISIIENYSTSLSKHFRSLMYRNEKEKIGLLALDSLEVNIEVNNHMEKYINNINHKKKQRSQYNSDVGFLRAVFTC